MGPALQSKAAVSGKMTKIPLSHHGLGCFCVWGLLLNINCDPGLEVHGEMSLKDSDLLNQAADQRLIKLRDGGRLAFDEILQFPDLLHLLVLDDAVHLGLPALVPEPENLISDGVVVVLLVDFFQEVFL